MSKRNSIDVIDVDTTDCHDPRLKKTKKTPDQNNVTRTDDRDTDTRDLQDMEGNTVRKRGDADANLARILQEQEYQFSLYSNGFSKEKIDEKKAMKTTHTGRAWEFVRTVVDRHQKLASSPKGRGDKISNVAVDDMVFQAERLLDCQEDFEQLNAPSKVTLAYHYTRDYNMESIKSEGLMTRADKSRTSIGLAYGDGVYVSTNPFAFHGKYGNVGILVAVLMGNTQRAVGRPRFSNTAHFDNVNTIIGNKKWASGDQPEAQLYDEIVLQNSRQCLPLVRFSDRLVSTTDDNSPSNDSIWAYHREMQRIVDACFNNGTKTEIARTFPSEIQNFNFPSASHFSHLSSIPQHKASVPPASMPVFHAPMKCPILKHSLLPPSVFQHKVPPPPNPYFFAAAPPPITASAFIPLPCQSTRTAAQTTRPTFSTPLSLVQPPAETNIIRYLAPETLITLKRNMFNTVDIISTAEDCPICMEQLCSSERIVSLKCDHKFHHGCIESALIVDPKCPICRHIVDEPQGKSPSGKLTIYRSGIKCGGFEHEHHGSITLTYHLNGDVQKRYHPNPGVWYAATTRTGYLPDNEDGNKLLARLKYAWAKGLSFTVGTSTTTGRPNSITWSSIHHKSSPSGGSRAHGFPDESYFLNCNEELDSLGVPSEEDCNKYSI